MRARILAAVAALAVHTAWPVHGQTFSAHSELVVLHVTVTSGSDAYVSDLPRQAFAVLDDDHPQQVTFLADANTPVTVGLVIDSSASMQFNRDLVIAAATAFAEAGREGDEVFGLAFNDEVRPVLSASAPFTSDAHVIRGALDRAINARGRTALFDAISAGLDYVERGSRERRVLVVVSDGGDNASHATLDEVLTKARASNAVVYAIVLADPIDGKANPRPLRQIAAASGGDVFRPRRPQQVGDVFRRIADDIRHAYTIGYVPTNAVRDGRYHRVRVIVDDPGGRRVKVRTRDGYLAGRPDPSVAGGPSDIGERGAARAEDSGRTEER